MDEGGCGSSGLWNICSDISLDNVVLSFYYWVTFKWDYLMWFIIALLVCIGLWTKLRIYRVPPDPFRWYCQGFGYIWQSFMLIWMIWSKNYLKLSHRKQGNAPSNMKLAASSINFECQPWGIFKGVSYHQEYKAIDPTIFAATVGLGDIIKKLVSSNFMGIVISVSVIFDTGDT